MKRKFVERFFLILLAGGLLFAFTAQGQKLNPKNTKNKVGLRSVFPVLPGYRKTIQKPQLDEEGETRFQMANYQKSGDNRNAFEISFERLDFTTEEYIANRELERIKISGFDAVRVLPTCGLDFREYALEIFIDEHIIARIGVYPDSAIDGIKLAESLDYAKILAAMRTEKRVY